VKIQPSGSSGCIPGSRRKAGAIQGAPKSRD